MAHYIYNDDTEETVVFSSFSPEKMLDTIKRMLKETPKATVIHKKDHTNKKYFGREIINFYENAPKTGKPSKVVTRGNKDYFQPLND